MKDMILIIAVLVSLASCVALLPDAIDNAFQTPTVHGVDRAEIIRNLDHPRRMP